MLDTNMVSYIVHGNSNAARLRFDRLLPEDELCISSITEGEILYGMAKQPDARTFHSNMRLFLSEIEVLPWDHEEASVYGVLRAQQQRVGKSLEALDMLIAAHALARSATLITHDKVFQYVSGLIVSDWATDL
jgi:tRNA(fMet)-specific endonuclease VapC